MNHDQFQVCPWLVVVPSEAFGTVTTFPLPFNFKSDVFECRSQAIVEWSTSLGNRFPLESINKELSLFIFSFRIRYVSAIYPDGRAKPHPAWGCGKTAPEHAIGHQDCKYYLRHGQSCQWSLVRCISGWK